ncbi:coproporphyrinogen-III oxidase family protein [Azorhizobium doebereinerae]|uniref:coproporphyrinogen-III oxidase family protein n=1 Tax=Azorhizobium doebereinerae TaxID=281091 RepID=UPI0018DE23C8|nr:radical SAM protein [Azorhizobium doebereinerae]
MYPPKTSYSSEVHVDVVEKELAGLAGALVSAYVHIPFCNMKCNFCSLLTLPGGSDPTVSVYIDNLKREIVNFGARFQRAKPVVSVLYFGGGTPALLPERQLAEVLEQLQLAVDTTQLLSCSVEFSPDVVDEVTTGAWRRHGFNRASLGVQTFNDALLKTMGRRHTATHARAAIGNLANAGYEDINVDLIFGFPGQTAQVWGDDLRAVVASEATHCTFHPLSVRPKVALERKAISPTSAVASLEDRHGQAIGHFQEAGWTQTSAISFSRLSIPNPIESAEAAGQPTIGFGAGSRSYYPSVHTSTVPYATRTPFGAVLRRYYESVSAGRLPIASEVLLDAEERLRRILILQMHHGRIPKSMLSGLDSDIDDSLSTIMEGMLVEGYFVQRESDYLLTTAGSIKAAEMGLSLSSASVKRSLATVE